MCSLAGLCHVRCLKHVSGMLQQQTASAVRATVQIVMPDLTFACRCSWNPVCQLLSTMKNSASCSGSEQIDRRMRSMQKCVSFLRADLLLPFMYMLSQQCMQLMCPVSQGMNSCKLSMSVSMALQPAPLFRFIMSGSLCLRNSDVRQIATCKTACAELFCEYHVPISHSYRLNLHGQEGLNLTSVPSQSTL